VIYSGIFIYLRYLIFENVNGKNIYYITKLYNIINTYTYVYMYAIN